MDVLTYLNKDSLHHAYLIEGERTLVVPKIFKFCEDLNIKTFGNPDFFHLSIDNFKIEEAFSLRAMSNEKSFSPGRKIFVICVNNFSLDAENVLLKMFEEPIPNTHFFLIVPDVNALLKTLVSRFYLISKRQALSARPCLVEQAEKFISLPLRARLDFIKELLAESEEKEETDLANSARSRALKLLNGLETVLVSRMPLDILDIKTSCFEHLFKVRKFLRLPGSSVKTLMESVALVTPFLSER